MNLKVKKRKYFQPLAPIILEEDFKKYFLINKSIVKNLEWMGVLCDAKEEKGLGDDYCIKAKTEFLLALACATMAVAACCSIWFLARLPVSVAKSASSIRPWEADKFTLT